MEDYLKLHKHNAAEWIRLANENSLDLEEIMFQDKRGIYDRLDSLRLPRPKALFLKALHMKVESRKLRNSLKMLLQV